MRKHTFTPLVIAASISIGILIGVFYTTQFGGGNQMDIVTTSSGKLNSLMRIVESQYVDTVNIPDIIESAIPTVLAELDPHSAYIPAKDVQEVNDDLRGSFSGIGIQFTIQDDTIHVNNVIPGGPSEKVGLMAGDRIVMIDDTLFVGKTINNNLAMKKLKGPKGTEVKLGIKRQGEQSLLDFVIERGEIPVKSVDASYVIDDKYGYIKIEKFAETTFPEMLIALAQLRANDIEGLIIDLRSNTGGYMAPAIQMVNEFLGKDQLIVYTEGRQSPRQNFFSNGTGSSQDLPLVVLVDEGSASASEIFSGAIQDNDRGIIVGRRTFGKGLVQQQMDFNDGSALRLTIARYYTPSGRCIQKPYTKGDDEAYEMDLFTRYEHGEFFNSDSIHQDQSQVFRTALGRSVYGGGGIMPDVFVPSDTTGYSVYYNKAVSMGLVNRFSFHYCDQNRKNLEKLPDTELLTAYLGKQNIVEQFVKYAETKGLQRRNLQIAKSRQKLEQALYATIVYDMQNMESYVRYLNQSDPTVQKAIQILNEGQSWPQAPKQQ